MCSFHILPKGSGPALHHCVFSVSILSVLVVRGSFQKLRLILSSKSRIWLRDKVYPAFIEKSGFLLDFIGDNKPFIRNVFTLNTCAHIVGSQVITHDDESKMLSAWRVFVEEVDPDIIIGYNISGFDLPYLLDRAHSLKINNFPYFGRMKGMQFTSIEWCSLIVLLGVKTQVKDTHFSSKAFGQRDSKETQIEGRLQLDLLQFMQREHKLRSYTLNSVCAQFLGEQKEDVHHSVITELQNGTPESRRRLAVYCLKVPSEPIFILLYISLFLGCVPSATFAGQAHGPGQLYRNGSCNGCSFQLSIESGSVYKSTVSIVPEGEWWRICYSGYEIWRCVFSMKICLRFLYLSLRVGWTVRRCYCHWATERVLWCSDCHPWFQFFVSINYDGT